MVSKLETAQRKRWTDSGKTVDDVFRLLKLGDEGDKLFQSPVENLWGMYATKRGGDSAGDLMFQSLMKSHDEASLVKMLLETKKSSDNVLKKISMKVESAQLASWARKEKTVDDVYLLLNLGNEGVKLFKSPVADV